MDVVLPATLFASIAVHTFMEPGFWAGNRLAMHEESLPASEVYAAKKQSKIAGFAAIRNGWLAALFADPTVFPHGTNGFVLTPGNRNC